MQSSRISKKTSDVSREITPSIVNGNLDINNILTLGCFTVRALIKTEMIACKVVKTDLKRGRQGKYIVSNLVQHL